MKTEDIKMIIAGYIRLYLTGLYSVSDTLKQIDNTIQEKTVYTIDTGERIKQQTELYRYSLDKLHKAIIRFDRLNN